MTSKFSSQKSTTLPNHKKYREGKGGCTRVNPDAQGLFLCYYLSITVLFSIRTTANLLWPPPCVSVTSPGAAPRQVTPEERLSLILLAEVPSQAYDQLLSQDKGLVGTKGKLNSRLK